MKPKSSPAAQKQKIQQFLQARRSNLQAKPSFNKTFGTQAKIAAMHNIQRASGRRGN